MIRIGFAKNAGPENQCRCHMVENAGRKQFESLSSNKVSQSNSSCKVAKLILSSDSGLLRIRSFYLPAVQTLLCRKCHCCLELKQHHMMFNFYRNDSEPCAASYTVYDLLI